jgi:hypothetical protein
MIKWLSKLLWRRMEPLQTYIIGGKEMTLREIIAGFLFYKQKFEEYEKVTLGCHLSPGYQIHKATK